MSKSEQTIVHSDGRGRIACMDSAYDVDERNSNSDVVVTGSYSGVLCARFVSAHRPRGVVGVECAIGPEGASIAGLWYYEALDIPAVAVDVMTIILGNGVDVYERGVVSRLNEPARRRGIENGMSVRDCADKMLQVTELRKEAPADITHRTTVFESEDGAIVCTDSIAFALPEDKNRNVLCTAGHTGRSAVPYLESAMPKGFICSDGGRGRQDSGIEGLKLVAPLGLAGATVDARSAMMGNGLSTYHDGIISAINDPAASLGLTVGMTAKSAAELLLKGTND